MMNISQKIKANTVMWIAGLLSIAVALVFPMEQYENFLLFIGAMFMPLFGVVLTDYFLLRKGQLTLAAIDTVDGPYWYYKGVNITAAVAWAAGFVTFEIIALMKYAVGGSLPSMLVAGLSYYFISRGKV
jgi:cytosine/uracil/thiamine/allantoin permease